MSEEAQQSEASVEPAQREAASVLPAVGGLLIAARERWNLSAADVARQLRLGLRQVEALETNRFDALPGNTFVRGFIRNYAKVVQEEPGVFLEAYERCRPQTQPREFVPAAEHIAFPSKSMPKWVWYLGGAAVLALIVPLLIYFALHDDDTPRKVHGSATPAKSPLNLTHEVPLILPPPQGVLQQAGPNAASSVTATTPAASIPPAALGTVPRVAPPVASGDKTLTLHFDGDAWVEIRDKSGQKIFSQLSRAGSEQAVQGTPPFALVVGNAARVRITYNGKPVDLAPYIKVNVARFTLE